MCGGSRSSCSPWAMRTDGAPQLAAASVCDLNLRLLVLLGFPIAGNAKPDEKAEQPERDDCGEVRDRHEGADNQEVFQGREKPTTSAARGTTALKQSAVDDVAIVQSEP